MQIAAALSRHRWARFVCAALSGVALALAFPKANVWVLAFFALTPLIMAAVSAVSWREAILLGELALAITWLINVPWLVNVMTFYGGLGSVVAIVLFVALTLVLGVYGALFSLGVYLLHPSKRFAPWLAIPFLWAATEYARSKLLTGFPWNILGTALVDVRPVAILSAIFGPFALGAFAVFVATMLAWLLTTPSSGRHRVMVAGSGTAFVAAALTLGWLTLGAREKTIGPPQARAALLQPNISQEMRWDTQNLLDIFGRMAEMTDRAADAGVDTVIWPESSVPLSFARTPFYRDYIEAVSRSRQIDVILGSVAEDDTEESKIWNAAYLVSNGETRGRYDKMHLVPFGEYVPLRKVIFFAEKLVRQVGEFQFGTNNRPLAGRHRYGLAICYEVVFPRISATQIVNGADVLVTVTNDAWFGDSAAPPQHLQMARMRAVEGDRYLLRSATTGISAVVDPTGRLVESIPLGRQGTILAGFSPRHSMTPYVRFGDWFAILAVVVSAAAIFLRRKNVHG